MAHTCGTPAGQWLVVMASVLWGTAGVAHAYTPPGTSPYAVGAARLVVGGCTLLVFGFLSGCFRVKGRWPLAVTLLAAAGVAAYQPFFFAGVSRIGVGVGSLITLGSAPILGGIIGFLVRGERPGLQWGFATLAAIGGCGLILVPSGPVSLDPSGVLMALAAGLAVSVYNVASKQLLDYNQPELVVTVVISLGAALVFPVLVVAKADWLLNLQGLAVALYLGVFTTATTHFLFIRGLSLIPAATAVTLLLAEPLTAALLGVTLLGERPTPLVLAGMLLLLGGLLILSLKGKGRDHHEDYDPPGPTELAPLWEDSPPA